jgi:protein-disulfide isomerase
MHFKSQFSSHMDTEHAHEETAHTSAPVTETPKSAPAQKQSLAIPIAIVIGFALIAVAIFLSGDGAKNLPIPGLTQEDTTTETPTTGEVRAVDENDHIRGNPNAPIVLIEYSDYDCPFCKNFHETMNQVMDNYGAEGKVAWVYRHFPLEQLHPSAPYIAQASECVAELGGNDAFWKFSDLVFGERGTNEPTNISRLSEFAETAGVGVPAFEACLEDGRTKALVEEDFRDAINAGGKGTPHTLVLVGGQQGVINGAQPYEAVSQILDTLIEQIETAQ